MTESVKTIRLFYNKMFKGEPVVILGRKFPLGKTGKLRTYNVGNLKFIEQNPDKSTVWARMAKKGRKIMWIIDVKHDKYLYRVVDGKINKLKI